MCPGPATLPWEINDVPHGVVHRHLYRSAIMGDERPFLVYTPPGYDPAAEQDLSRALSPARLQRRRGCLDLRRPGERHPRQPHRPGQGQAHADRDAAGLRQQGSHRRRLGGPAEHRGLAGQHREVPRRASSRRSSRRWRRPTASRRTASPAPSRACPWAGRSRSSSASTPRTASPGSGPSVPAASTRTSRGPIRR